MAEISKGRGIRQRRAAPFPPEFVASGSEAKVVPEKPAEVRACRPPVVAPIGMGKLFLEPAELTKGLAASRSMAVAVYNRWGTLVELRSVFPYFTTTGRKVALTDLRRGAGGWEAKAVSGEWIPVDDLSPYRVPPRPEPVDEVMTNNDWGNVLRVDGVYPERYGRRGKPVRIVALGRFLDRDGEPVGDWYAKVREFRPGKLETGAERWIHVNHLGAGPECGKGWEDPLVASDSFRKTSAY